VQQIALEILRNEEHAENVARIDLAFCGRDVRQHHGDGDVRRRVDEPRQIATALGAVLIAKRLRFISGSAKFLHRRGLNEKWIEKAGSLEDRVYGFYQRNSARFLPILLLECCFHLAGAAEIYITLSFISPDQPPTFLTAFILESVNRIITVAFKFIPLRMGVDEAGTGRVSKILQFTMATGVTLAIVRKARDVFWAATGMILLLQRGLSLRSVARDAEAALAEEAKLRAPSELSPRGTN